MLALLMITSCQTTNSSKDSPAGTTNLNRNMTRAPLIGPIKYVALGDSTGVGVGAAKGGYVSRLFRRMEKARPGSTLTNLCVSGATSDDVRNNQLEQALKAKPTFVTLGIGINDIGHGFSPEAFAENVDAVLRQLQSQTEARVVVSNIPDISTAPRIPELMRPEIKRLIVLFNQKLDEIARRYGATVVDIHQATREQLATHPEYFSSDGFHPSDIGYETWAEQMWPTVAAEIGVAEKD